MTAFDQPPQPDMELLRCTEHGTPITWVTAPLPGADVRIGCIGACDGDVAQDAGEEASQQ